MPNVAAAAMGVLNDWRDGRVQGWVDVPVDEEGRDSSRSEVKTVVKEWAREFKIEGLWGDDEDEGEREEGGENKEEKNEEGEGGGENQEEKNEKGEGGEESKAEVGKEGQRKEAEVDAMEGMEK